ncbi:hypothetical protein BGZ94_001320 [Podila epigama]|nr:hypothetical protein BGZ94_001320 [Podila epigama]
MASPLHVMIVGAGISGLMCAALLEKANISYEVFEKAQELKPLGTALSLTPATMPLFEQLGLYERLIALCKPFGALRLWHEDLSPVGAFQLSENKNVTTERYGYDSNIISRSDLVDLLLTLVPPNRIHFGKRVLSMSQDEEKVTLCCSDNEKFVGSILVGADGAYSTTRRHMYSEMSKAGILPKADSAPLGYEYDCVVGVADELDPVKYPVLKQEFCDFQTVLGKVIPYTWWFIPLANNKIGWMVTQDIRGKGTDEGRVSSSSEWGPDAAIDMCNRVRHLPCIYGGTLGDIIDSTPKELVSKVMLEDKVGTLALGLMAELFSWVMMLPFGGQGANMAIHDAVELVNLLFEIETDSQEEIADAFALYHDARREACKTAVNSSNQSGSMMHSKGLFFDLIRYVALNWLPDWASEKAADKINAYRPQASFLPHVKKRGSIMYQSSPPSRKVVPGAQHAVGSVVL